MKTIQIEINDLDSDGNPAKETLQWYLDELNKASFNSIDAKESITDFINEILIRI